MDKWHILFQVGTSSDIDINNGCKKYKDIGPNNSWTYDKNKIQNILIILSVFECNHMTTVTTVFSNLQDNRTTSSSWMIVILHPANGMPFSLVILTVKVSRIITQAPDREIGQTEKHGIIS